MAEHIQNPQIFTNAGELSGKCGNYQPEMRIGILRDECEKLRKLLSEVAPILEEELAWSRHNGQAYLNLPLLDKLRAALAQSAERAKEKV